MLFSVELLDLFLYCVQQLGVMLAVGAETIVLIAYLVSMRDGKVEDTEARFSRAIHRALLIGLSLVVLSGIAIVWLHLTLHEGVVFEPVFLFKWLLILTLVGIYISQKGKPFSHPLVEGVVGGIWYTLFLIHILAPQTTWVNLFTLFVVFVGGFVALWSVFTSVSKKHITKIEPMKKVAIPTPPQAPTPAAVVASMPKPTPVSPPVPSAPQPAVAIIETKIPDPPALPVLPPEPHHSHWLPAIHVMPKDQKQLEDKSHITPLSKINKPA